MKLTQHCIRHRRLLFMLDQLSRRIEYGAAYTELEAATAASKWEAANAVQSTQPRVRASRRANARA